MCGIVGRFDLQVGLPNRHLNIQSMNDALRHRGPDDDGVFVSDHVALGMRRLSIVDVKQGKQPVYSDDGSIQLVFNGEIYNHNELRKDLESQYSFRSRSDSEVLLRAYEKWGMASLKRLNGMFAIAIWDGRENVLRLVRDRMGVKPLYYHWDGSTLSFASEIKALVAGLKTKPTLNESAIWDYLTYRYVPQDNCVWQNMHKLSPGHFLEISLDKPEPRVKQWWEIPNKPIRGVREEDLVQQFSELLESSVDMRMLADVPVGILLSGGLDSSVIAALAHREKHNLTTFSVGFKDEPDANELAYARSMAKHLGSAHHDIEIGISDFCDYLPKMVFDCDEPMADLASVPLYYITKEASKSVKVLLSGEGSDEILAGYNFNDWVRSWSLPSKNGPMARTSGWLTRLLGREAAGPDMGNPNSQLCMTNYMSSLEKAQLLPNLYGMRNSFERTSTLYNQAGKRPALDKALYAYSHDWLVEDLLMKADKTSMANSVEVRTPFLDYRLVEFCFSLPMSMKVGPYEGDAFATKRVLRQIAQKLVPHSIIDRPKQGFPVPAYRWIRNELSGWARDLLDSNASKIAGMVDRAELSRLLNEGLDERGELHKAHIVWHLLVLELWLTRWSA